MPIKEPTPYVYAEDVFGSVPVGSEDGQVAKYA
jgi:hypothetical protein